MVKIIDIAQRSEEWHRFRSTRLGASESAMVLDESSFGNPTKLYEKKKGIDQKNFTSKAMQQGIDYEPDALRWLNHTTKSSYKPLVGSYDQHERFIASLDGYCEETGVIAEIKSSQKIFDAAKNGRIDKEYIIQMNHQMMVFDAKKTLFVAFDGFDGIIIEVDRDEALIQRIYEEGVKFLECLDNDLCPEDDYIEVIVDDEEIVYEYVALSEQIKYLTKQQKAQKQLIEDLGDSGNMIVCSRSGRQLLKLTRVSKKGTVDWESLCKKHNISDEEIESFRGDQIGYYSYSVLKK
jgi:putative phage-type endonuclease